MPRLYERAKDAAAIALGRYGEIDAAKQLSAVCPYTLEQVLAPGWYPEVPGKADRKTPSALYRAPLAANSVGHDIEDFASPAFLPPPWAPDSL